MAGELVSGGELVSENWCHKSKCISRIVAPATAPAARIESAEGTAVHVVHNNSGSLGLRALLYQFARVLEGAPSRRTLL